MLFVCVLLFVVVVVNMLKASKREVKAARKDTKATCTNPTCVASAAVAPLMKIETGRMVLISGIKSQPALNGTIGAVIRPTRGKAERWDVKVKVNDAAISLHGRCLAVVKNAKLNPGEGQRCAGCLCRYYCSVACQTEHWPLHKRECKLFKKVRRLPLESKELVASDSGGGWRVGTLSGEVYVMHLYAAAGPDSNRQVLLGGGDHDVGGATAKNVIEAVCTTCRSPRFDLFSHAGKTHVLRNHTVRVRGYR